MTYIAAPLLRLPITKKESRAIYTIRAAKWNEIPAVTRLYNRDLDPKYENGLFVGKEHIEARLGEDPQSVLIGTVDGKEEPIGEINVIKLKLPGLSYLPPKSAELTGEEKWGTTDPYNANCYVCTWVTVAPEWRNGWKGEFLGKPRSPGQLLILAVALSALREGKQLDGLIAYSRPFGLREYLEEYSREKFSFADAGRMTLGRLGELSTSKTSLYYNNNSNGGPKRIIQIANYAWAGIDPVLSFHLKNGACLDPRLIFAHGHNGDRNALFFKVGLLYDPRLVLALAA